MSIMAVVLHALESAQRDLPLGVDRSIGTASREYGKQIESPRWGVFSPASRTLASRPPGLRCRAETLLAMGGFDDPQRESAKPAQMRRGRYVTSPSHFTSADECQHFSLIMPTPVFLLHSLPRSLIMKILGPVRHCRACTPAPK